MSTFPAARVSSISAPWLSRREPWRAAGLVSVLAVLGVTSVWPTVLYLWDLWTKDALKSIGMLVPIVSLILILRAWRALGWSMNGTWWGLAILLFISAIVHLREQSVLVLVISPQWSVFLPPHSLIAFAYAAGIVLLFGGTSLFRAALFPIALMWFVNPIPHIFNVLVDLPLQQVSAHVARWFAMALGQPLSPDQMRLMFTPDFGMFIAPGCNGIRGAVTMGFVALIAGYIYRFRPYAHAGVVAIAILLGYVFNFVRLCTLVLYYIVALRWTRLQAHAEMGDYIIGACLFLFATFLLFALVRRFGHTAPSPDPRRESSPVINRGGGEAQGRSLTHRLAAMSVFALLSCGRLAMASLYPQSAGPAVIADQTTLGQFPAKIGGYTLARSWNEYLTTGPLIFHWADYAPAGGGTHVAIGVSPVLGSHDTLICHSARGEDPIWHAQMPVKMSDGAPVDFSASFFNDGATQYLEASTLCNGSACGEYSADRTHFGLVYSRPQPASIFSQDPERPIPVLVRAETADTTLPPEFARQQLAKSLTSFLSAVSLDGLTQPYRRR